MSNQISPEEMQRRGALLKKAKQILLQEYAAIRTQQHQQWIKDSETSWRTNGVLMAYPPGKLYPTEQEIIDKALELYNRSIAATALKVEVPEVSIIATQNTQPEPSIDEPLGSSPMDVTAKLEEVYKKGPINPNLTAHLLSTPIDKYVESLTQPTEQPTQPVQDEPVEDNTPSVDEIPADTPETGNTTETTTETTDTPAIEVSVTPKHSLLRSVLSGWLSKNKDKET